MDGLGKRPEQQRPSLGLSCVHPRRRFSDSPGLRTEQAAPSPQLRGCHLFAPTGAQPGDERLRSLELSAYVGTTGRGFLLDNHYILGIEVLENESRSFRLFVLGPLDTTLLCLSSVPFRGFLRWHTLGGCCSWVHTERRRRTEQGSPSTRESNRTGRTRTRIRALRKPGIQIERHA